jgi:diaminobutyrate-2-oxoglutarate transaminase
MYDNFIKLEEIDSENKLEELWINSIKPYVFDRDESFIATQEKHESNARTYARKFPISIRKGLGIYVEDTKGKIFMDCLAGAGTLALGHNHPLVIEALRDCLDNQNVLMALDISTPVKDRFINTLLENLPKEFADNCKLQFCSPSGADAVEAAIKLCKIATGRSGVFSFTGGYHGMTHGALSLTASKAEKLLVSNLMKDVTFLPYPYNYRCPFGIGGDACDDVSLHYIENILKDSHSGINLPAAFILEVVQGEGGVIVSSDKWIKGIREITQRYNIPLIIDEVQTGVGRTGTMFAFEASGIIPDIIVISKAIGGSLPLSLIAYDKKFDKWTAGAHAGTFRGNQLAMNAGIAVLDHIRDNNILDNVKKQGEYFINELNILKQKYSCIGEVRGKGLMIGIEIVDPLSSKDNLGIFQTNYELSKKIQISCLENGLIVELGGRNDSVIRLLPPLTITNKQAKNIIGILNNVIKEYY